MTEHKFTPGQQRKADAAAITAAFDHFAAHPEELPQEIVEAVRGMERYFRDQKDTPDAGN